MPEILTHPKESLSDKCNHHYITKLYLAYLAITDDIDRVIQSHYIYVGIVDITIEQIYFLELYQKMQVRNVSLNFKGWSSSEERRICTGALFVFTKIIDRLCKPLINN